MSQLGSLAARSLAATSGQLPALAPSIASGHEIAPRPSGAVHPNSPHPHVKACSCVQCDMDGTLRCEAWDLYAPAHPFAARMGVRTRPGPAGTSQIQSLVSTARCGFRPRHCSLLFLLFLRPLRAMSRRVIRSDMKHTRLGPNSMSLWASGSCSIVERERLSTRVQTTR